MSFIDKIKKLHMEKRVSLIMEPLLPYLTDFSICGGEFSNELLQDDQLLRRLEFVLRNPANAGLSVDEIRWVLQPLKIYQNHMNMQVHFDNLERCSEVVSNLIDKKWEYVSKHYCEVNRDISFDDSVEKAILMTKSFSAEDAYRFLDCYFDNRESFYYIVDEMPYLDFIRSIGYEDDEASYMRRRFFSFLNIDSRLLDSIVRTNISHFQENGFAFDSSYMGTIFSALEEKEMLSGYFDEVLSFLYQFNKTPKERVYFFPILAELSSIWPLNLSFIKSLNCIPDTFFQYLDCNLPQKRREILTLFENELVESSNLFSNLDLLDKRNPSEQFCQSVYRILLTEKYQLLKPEQKERVMEFFDGIDDAPVGCDILKNIQLIFEESELQVENIQDLQIFEDVILFIASATEEEYEMKLGAFFLVNDQLEAHYLNRYLWYLRNSSLTTEDEYKAHCAYFRKHSIDDFFQDLDFCDPDKVGGKYQQDILTLVTDDYKKKKQHLRFVKKANPYMFPKDKKRVLDVLEYSDDVNHIKSVVDMTTNPIFQSLSPTLQSTVLESIEPTIESDVSVVSFHNSSILDELSEQEFVKCKTIGGKNNSQVLLCKNNK